MRKGEYVIILLVVVVAVIVLLDVVDSRALRERWSKLRFNGWQRIGIVASLAWIVFVGFVGIVQIAMAGFKFDTDLVGWLLGPLLAGWLGAYALVAVVRWVVAGFRGK